MYIWSHHAEGQQVVMFFGELIRHGLFSHDVFVRHLIALGVFEPSWTDQVRASFASRNADVRLDSW